MKKNLWTAALTLSAVALLSACSFGTRASSSPEGQPPLSSEPSQSKSESSISPEFSSESKISSEPASESMDSSAEQPQSKESEQPATVLCTFLNYDGTKLYEYSIGKGSTAYYSGSTPTKPDETQDGQTVHWTFTGWDKSLWNIQADTVFTAQFAWMHTCTFKNYNGSFLWSKSVKHGESVVYKGKTPVTPTTISGSATIEWTFTGWDKSLDNITEDTTFTAQFHTSNPNVFACTFFNYDGTQLGLVYCLAGERAAYEGETPTKPDYDNGKGTIIKYTFSGWDNSLKNIQYPMIFTAQYSESFAYECKFVNFDGTVLYETSVTHGYDAYYQGETPTRDQVSVDPSELSELDETVDPYAPIVYEYTFTGWDKSVSNITAPTTFTAQYSVQTFNGYKVTFLEADGSELYSHYFKKGSNAVYPYELPWSYDSENVTMFTGWSGSIKDIQEERTVKATYKTISRRQNGEYPQTLVTDNDLIKTLDAKARVDQQGYYVYQGEKYERHTSSWVRETLYYRVEPIHWQLLSSEGGDFFLVSDKILDGHEYGVDQKYDESEVRRYLNEDFLEKAFYYNDSLIVTATVDNLASSAGYESSKYACGTTRDKIFLLSYAEVTNPEYGFVTDADRVCEKKQLCFLSTRRDG